MRHNLLPRCLCSSLFLGLALLLGGCSGKGTADRGNNRSSLAQSAQAYLDAMKTGDFAKQVDLTLPFLVKMLGGPDRYEQTLRNLATEIRIVPESFRKEEPGEIASDESVLIGAVPYSISMDVKGQRFEVHGSMVGISEDNGRTWRFVEGNRNTPRLLSQLYPKVKVTIPAAYRVGPGGERTPL